MISKRHKITALAISLILIISIPIIFYSYGWIGLNGLNDEVYADTLKISIHTDMLDPDVLNEFQDETGIYLDIHYHDSNEEGFFRTRVTDFDLIMVDQFIIQEFSEYLHPINQNNIENRRNLDYRFTTLPHDFGLRYSFPVFWGSFGYAYSESQYSGLPLSWSYLFSPNLAYRGYISVLNDERYTLGTALLYLGLSPNSTDSTEIQAAADLIEDAKYYYRSFSGKDELIEMYKKGEITAFPIWSGTATKLKRTHPQTRFILPAEGALFFVSSFVIMKDSDKDKQAERFIDFNIEPTRMARHTNYGAFANTIPASKKYIDRRIVMGPSYINPFLTQASYSLDALDPEVLELYDEIWLRLNPTDFQGYAPPPIYEFR